MTAREKSLTKLSNIGTIYCLLLKKKRGCARVNFINGSLVFILFCLIFFCYKVDKVIVYFYKC